MRLKDMFARSSFGMGIDNLKDKIEAYALRIHDAMGLKIPVDIAFARLDPDKGGGSGVIFDENRKPSLHAIVLNSMYFDDARGHEARDDAFVRYIVDVGHELAHAFQFEHGDSEMALCRIADMGNEIMYKRNYAHNMREINAEMQGISFAEAFFREQIPAEQVEKLLLRYVNSRMREGGYHVGTTDPDGFKSITVVTDAFDSAYDAALMYVSNYGAKAPMGCEDAFSVVTGLGFEKRRDKNWDFVSDALARAHDAHESNMILASVALHVYPYLEREAGDALLPDLSIRSVFGCDPPSIQPQRSPKMAVLIEQAERDRARGPGDKSFEYTK